MMRVAFRAFAVAVVLAVPLLTATTASAELSASGSCTGSLLGAPVYQSASAILLVTAVTASGSQLVLSPYGGVNIPVVAGTALVVQVSGAGDGAAGGAVVTFNGTSIAGNVASFTAPATAGVFAISASYSAGLYCRIDLPLSGSLTVTAAPVSVPVSSGAVVPATAATTSTSDSRPPGVRPQRMTTNALATTSFRYFVTGETKPTSEVIDVRKTLNAIPVKKWRIRTGMNKSAANITKLTLPPAVTRGRWFWCVTSTDSSGNSSRPICAPLVVK